MHERRKETIRDDDTRASTRLTNVMHVDPPSLGRPTSKMSTPPRRAPITGITDSYLAELLLEKGYEVHGIIRRLEFQHRAHRPSLPGPHDPG